MRTLLTSLTIGAVALALGGCEQAKKGLSTLDDLRAVQRQVIALAGTEDVRVNLNNGRFLNVGVVNSPLRSLPDDERNAKAIEIARAAYQAYPARDTLASVAVTFVRQRSYIVFHYTDGSDHFEFRPEQLASPRSG